MTEAAHINDTPANIKVAVIEDRREIGEGLGTLIQFTDGYSCVGRFYSMEEAPQQIGASPPDVAPLDIRVHSKSEAVAKALRQGIV